MYKVLVTGYGKDGYPMLINSMPNQAENLPLKNAADNNSAIKPELNKAERSEIPFDRIDTSSVSKKELDDINKLIKPFCGAGEEGKLSVVADLVQYAKDHPYASSFISSVGGFLTGYIVEKHLEATKLMEEIKNLEQRKEMLSSEKDNLKEELAYKRSHLDFRGRGMDMLMGAAGGLVIAGMPAAVNLPLPLPLRLGAISISLAAGAIFGLLFNINLGLKRAGYDQ